MRLIVWQYNSFLSVGKYSVPIKTISLSQSVTVPILLSHYSHTVSLYVHLSVQFSPLSSPSYPCYNGTAVSVGKERAEYNTHLTLLCQIILVRVFLFRVLACGLKSQTRICTYPYIV
jgi:nitric oxide reductase large subunit